MQGRREISGFAIGGWLAAAALAGLPTAASADTFCEYVDAEPPGPAHNILSVVAFGEELEEELEESELGIPETVTIRRAGERIVVRDPRGPVRCDGGEPTVTNIDRMRIVSDFSAGVALDLGGGALGPGATDEGDGSSEIELSFLSEYGFLQVLGGAGADRFVAGRSHESAPSALNLNPRADRGAGDADVILGEESVAIFAGGPGHDSFDARGGESFRLGIDTPLLLLGEGGDDSMLTEGTLSLALAGRGDDLLRGGADRDRLMGEAGEDVLEGAAGRDALDGGPGRDRVMGGADPDQVRARDRRSDRVDCGPGHDRLRSLDDDDRHRRCERLGRPPPRGVPAPPVTLPDRLGRLLPELFDRPR
jgi:RTX calcium-binding nonapeptide repeat (4 copies)